MAIMRRTFRDWRGLPWWYWRALARRRGGVIYPIDDVGGDAPLFAYSTAKLVSGYDGPALRVIRTSDSAEADIGFSGQRLDEATLSSFLSGATGMVLTFYDQSGNAHHSTQVATAQQGSVDLNVRHGAHPTIHMGEGLYPLPGTIGWDRQDASHYAVLEPKQSGQDGVIQIGTTADPWQFFQPGMETGFLYVSGGAVRTPSRPHTVEFHLSTTATIHMVGPDTFTAAAHSAGAEAGGSIGFADFGYHYTGHGTAWVGYGRALSTGERTSIKAALARVFGTEVLPGRVIWQGDSITSGAFGTNDYGYAKRAQRLLPKVQFYQAGAGGKQTTHVLTDYATGVGALLDLYTDNRIVFYLLGTNDIDVGARTASAIYADIGTYVANVQADGAKIIVATILPNAGSDATERQTRADLNTMIRTNAAGADAICDFAADPIMGQLNAPAPYYVDGLHPSNEGHAILAPLAAAAIQALL